jgi:hypothetical protein
MVSGAQLSPLRIPFLLCLALSLISCATGPAPNTPPWFWQAAQDTYRMGDYLKAIDHLQPLIAPGGEFTERAQPFRLVLTAGLARGYIDLAEAFEAGARMNEKAATEFRRRMNVYRSQANRRTMNFAESFLAFEKTGPGAAIPIAFPYPSGNPLPVAELTKAGQGIALSETELATAERRAIERAILMVASTAVGAEDDTAKAQQIFSGQNVTVPKETFLLGMAKQLHGLSQLYAPAKMNEPDKFQLLNERALEALKSVPETPETKALLEKVEKALKPKK